jgi:hypothetical protein
MIIYKGYFIIESKEEFENNFIVGDYCYEHKTKSWLSFGYYEDVPKSFPCAYKQPINSFSRRWKPCPIKEAVDYWNKEIPNEIEKLTKFLSEINNFT